MSKKIALLHTSLVFIQKERMLFHILEELLPNAELVNIVDDKMLQDVIREGAITPSVTLRMCLYVLAASAMGVDAIFNTCSSLGPTMNAARQLDSTPVVRIDEGMAEKAARDGNKTGVVATLPTTLQPTVALIKEKAEMIHKRVEGRTALSEGAFRSLMQDQAEKHDEMVAETAREVSGWADTLALAQGSMARLAPRLESQLGLPVLSSPRLGVIHLKEVLG